MELKNPKWSLGKKLHSRETPTKKGCVKNLHNPSDSKTHKKFLKWVQPRRKYKGWNSYNIKIQVINRENKQDYKYTKHFK